ncbi:hypothetical protein EUGRSUZ_C03113 [Eucalyptus grandis]|uniref:Uncharacterized protein n=2 Tax=Eucalyptus grandis TaxID=71139 RepID=A0ACC3LHI2_EUCGR|nr:hypothetical protein EUGRSUZ_C03113 [Eucalyptus grandis]
MSFIIGQNLNQLKHDHGATTIFSAADCHVIGGLRYDLEVNKLVFFFLIVGRRERRFSCDFSSPLATDLAHRQPKPFAGSSERFEFFNYKNIKN